MADIRYVAKGVALTFGLISASVRMSAALEGKAAGTSNVLVCTTGHDAKQISQPRMCPECGEVPYQQLKKARPVEGGLVVLEREEIEAAQADATKFKSKAAVTAHPAEQVDLLSGVGEKLYYLSPEPGNEQQYTTILALVAAHRELAFMTQWTPRTALAQFQVRAVQGVLALQERTAGGSMREVPDIQLEENEQLIGLAEQVLALPSSVCDYDPATYASHFEERIAEIVAGKTVVPVDNAPVIEAVPVTDLMAALRKQVASNKRKRTKKEAA